MNIMIPDDKIMIKAKFGNHFVKPTDYFIMEIENSWPGMIKVERLYQNPIQLA